MDVWTRDRLLAVNRAFYRSAAPHFNSTRRRPWQGFDRILARLRLQASGHGLRLLDVGCGNGRLVHSLTALGFPVDYVGVDGSEELLRYAREDTADCPGIRCQFVERDLAQPDWWRPVASAAPYDAVICLATLHHMPGYPLRCRLLADLARLCDPGRGIVILSAWQFLSSPRLKARRLPWAQVGVSPMQVEPGDALLPWSQGVEAVRYAHEVDAAELARLAHDCHLTVEESYRADGHDRALNLYAFLRRQEPDHGPVT